MFLNKVCTAFSIFLLILAGHYSSNCQSGISTTGTGGLNTIQGRIYLPSGRTADAQITVRLESQRDTPITLLSDRNGGFSFRSLAPGNYSIVVDAGENYVVTREYFTIDGEVQTSTIRVPPVPKVYNVPVYLQFKPNAVVKNGVVNAKYVNIPKEALEHCQKGLEFSRAGNTQEAIKSFRLAISIYPQFSVPHTEIGKILLKTGKFDEAGDEFRVALTIDPSDFDAKLNLGIALMGKRDLNDAEKELRAAADLNKAAVTPHYYLGLLFLLQNRNLDDAQKEMETAKQLKGDKEFPLVHRYLGGIYWKKKQYRMAADELETYVKLLPNAKDADQTRKTILELRSRQN